MVYTMPLLYAIKWAFVKLWYHLSGTVCQWNIMQRSAETHGAKIRWASCEVLKEQVIIESAATIFWSIHPRDLKISTAGKKVCLFIRVVAACLPWGWTNSGTRWTNVISLFLQFTWIKLFYRICVFAIPRGVVDWVWMFNLTALQGQIRETTKSPGKNTNRNVVHHCYYGAVLKWASVVTTLVQHIVFSVSSFLEWLVIPKYFTFPCRYKRVSEAEI